MFDASIEVCWKMKCMGRRKEKNYASTIMSFSWCVLLLIIAINLNHWMRNCSIMVKNSYLMPSCSYMEIEGGISKINSKCILGAYHNLTQTT